LQEAWIPKKKEAEYSHLDSLDLQETSDSSSYFMPYYLNTSRILYQNSKYAPVAVIRLELEIPGVKTSEFNQSLVYAALDEISKSNTGGVILLPLKDSPIEIYCDLVLALQRYGGHEAGYSRVVEIEAPDHNYQVFIEYEDPATALYAAELTTDLLNVFLDNPQGLDAETALALQQPLEEFVRFAQVHRLDPNTRLLMVAAKAQDIPVLSLDQPWGMPTWPGALESSGVVQYGWGINQRRCQGPLPLGLVPRERLQQVADRALLLPHLKIAGIPLANQDLEFINRNQVKRAQRSARRIGYPVVLRPRTSDLFQYRFPDNLVFGPIWNDDQVALVAPYLREQAGVDVWVESAVAGDNYQFLILNNEVVSVFRCTPPTIVGDGVHTIAELARDQAETADDIRLKKTWLDLAKGDKGLACRLQLANLGLDSVPVSGEAIALRGMGTDYNGGSCTEVSHDIPAHFSAIALKSAEEAGYQHLTGIDLTISNLSGPADLPNCVVVGVDPAPDLALYSKLSEENQHEIPDRYLSLLFPAGRPARIPTVAVTGTNGKTTTCRMVTRILQAAGLKVGLSCSDGIYLDDEVLVQGDKSGVLGANEVLTDSRMEAAVLETARGNMANTGIAFDHCNVGACLNVAEDHLGQEGIETLDDMAIHKRQVIERTSGTAVLNAEDPLCLAMGGHTPARSVILTAHSANHPAIESHVSAGGRAVVLDSDSISQNIAIVENNEPRPLIEVKHIPATFEGSAFFNTENALAATAIALGLGIEEKSIKEGLHRFNMSIETTPGRMNLYQGLPFRLIVDHAHNAHGLNAFCKFIAQQGTTGKRIAVLFSIGDRSDDEILSNTGIVARHFDYFICRDPAQLHDREKGEIAQFTKSALMKHGVDESNIQVILDPITAIDEAIAIAQPGDLLVIFVGHAFHETIQQHVNSYSSSTQ